MNKAGFTLIELVLYLGIISLMAVSVMGIMAIVPKANSHSQAQAEVNDSFRFVFTKIQQDFQENALVSLTAPDPDCNASCTSDHLEGLFIDLAYHDQHSISYAVVNGALQRTYGGETTNLTSPDVFVSGLSFKKITNHNSIFNTDQRMFQIALTVAASSTVPDQQASSTIQTSISYDGI